MAEIMKVIGLMSGTSLDGIDAALVETDGEDIAVPGPSLTVPYAPQTRALLRASLDAARDVAEGGPVPHSIREAERLLTEAHAEAVKALLAKAGLGPGDVALIGFHGQTILHRPAQRWTWQIGDGALLARSARTPLAALAQLGRLSCQHGPHCLRVALFAGTGGHTAASHRRCHALPGRMAYTGTCIARTHAWSYMLAAMLPGRRAGAVR